MSRRNDRLRLAMAFHGLKYADVASVACVNVKTVQRWVYEGRIPRRRARARVAQLLDDDAHRLWPDLAPKAWTPDLVHLYTQLDDVPANLWTKLARNATSRIDVAGAMPLDPVLLKVISERIEAGVEVRLCLDRGPDVPNVPGLQIRQSTVRQSMALLRSDLTMLVWLRFGLPGLSHLGPVLRLGRVEDAGVFDTYAYLFETMWKDAVERKP